MKAAAQQSIRTAVEFHLSATNSAGLQLLKPALSSYIHAVVHAKDAICLEISGTTGSSKNHLAALDELRSTGKVPDHHLAQFESLMNSKTEIEYVSGPLRASRFQALSLQAERFLSFSYALLDFSPDLLVQVDLG